jgi:hypothetical protein
MADALDLTQALASAFPSSTATKSKQAADEDENEDDDAMTSLLQNTLSRFERKMQDRTEPYAVESAGNLDKCFSDPNAPEMFVEYVKSFGPPPFGTMVRLGIMAVSACAFVSMIGAQWLL